MQMSAFMIEDINKPLVTSHPPYINDNGGHEDARVSLQPFGDRLESGYLTFHMSVDDAEALGRRLLKVAQLAREGRYTD